MTQIGIQTMNKKCLNKIGVFLNFCKDFELIDLLSQVVWIKKNVSKLHTVNLS